MHHLKTWPKLLNSMIHLISSRISDQNNSKKKSTIHWNETSYNGFSIQI